LPTTVSSLAKDFTLCGNYVSLVWDFQVAYGFARFGNWKQRQARIQ